MAERLLIMNGQKILQSKESNGWKNKKVSKAVGLKAGLYNLSSAANADTEKTYEGVILHKDKEKVYQQTPKGIIAHSSSKFNESVSEGSVKSISYRGKDKAVVSSKLILQKSAKRSR